MSDGIDAYRGSFRSSCAGSAATTICVKSLKWAFGLLQGAYLACVDNKCGSHEQAEERARRYGYSGTPNPVSVMLAEAEAVVAAALIASMVTIVTARILNRWQRHRRSRN
jgi:hypothetical protein